MSDSHGVSRLKELLFDSESQALADLSRRIDRLTEINTDERRALRESIDGLFDRVGTPERMEYSVATILDGAIRRAEVDRHKELADAFSPLVVRTVRTEIRNSRDELVEALYPMTGRMVKAYVASAMKDLMQEVNRRIEQNPFMLRMASIVTGRSPAELALARRAVRAGLRALAAMGVVESRHGSGTYIHGGPPRLGTEPLEFLADLHGFTREEMYEARRVLEVGVAGLAAERVTPDHLASLAEEVASLFATMHDPEEFLVHDIRFHRMVAQCAGNPLLGSLVEMVSALYYERRRVTATRATDRNLQDAAEMHRRIYQAIRARDGALARQLMDEHLKASAAYQGEGEGRGGPPARAALAAPSPDRQRRGRAATRR